MTDSNSNPSSNAAWADYYGSQGLRMVVVHGIKPDGSCTCSDGNTCNKNGKHPLQTAWQKDPLDRERAVEFFSRPENEYYNIGLVMGTVSGVVAGDLDGPEGDEFLRWIQEEKGAYPRLTGEQISGSGVGRHLIIPLEPGEKASGVNQVHGVCIKGDGGQIVAAPSRHISGRTYQWVQPPNGKVSPGITASEFRSLVVEWHNMHKEKPSQSSSSASGSSIGEGLLYFPETLPDGQRDDWLFEYGKRLRGLGLAREAAAAVVQAMFPRIAQPVGDEFSLRDAIKAVSRGYDEYADTVPAEVMGWALQQSQSQPVAERETDLGYIDFSNPDTWKIKPALEVIPKVAREGHQIAIGARRGSGKSLLLSDMGAGAAVRGRFGGLTIPHRNVLIVSQENATEMEIARLQSMGYGASDDWERLKFSSLGDWPPFNTKQGVEALLREVDKHEADIVIIDSMSKVVLGDSNVNELYALMDRELLRPLKKRRVTTVVLDNFGKDPGRGLRGASAKEDIFDVVWEMAATDDEVYVTLTQTKDRTGTYVDKEVYFERERTPRTQHVYINGLPVAAQKQIDHNVRVDDLVDELDRIGCPNGYGREKAKQFVRDKKASITAHNKVWSDAVAIRKVRK